MDKYTLAVAVPTQLAGIKHEIEKVNNFCGKQIFIEVSECNDIKTLHFLVEKVESVGLLDYIVVFESLTETRINMLKAQEELLDILKKIKMSSTAKLIVVLQKGKDENRTFVNELIKLGIQDFYEIEKFASDDVLSWLFAPPKSLKDNISYIDNIIAHPIQKIEKIVEVERIVEVEKKIVGNVGSKLMGMITIGVFNICAGAGATSTAIAITEALAATGNKVVCVEADGKKDFNYLNSRCCKGEYVNFNADDFELLYSTVDCQFIVFDFGTLYDIDSTGEYLGTYSERKIISEFLRCNFKIATMYSDPWHCEKLQYYLKDEVYRKDISESRFKVLVSGMDGDEQIKRFGNQMDMYQRCDIDLLIKNLKEQIGLSAKTKEQRRRIFSIRK